MIIPVYTFSQNGAAINTTGYAADPSSILDISSTNSGILIPRMTEAQKNAISSPATGLMIYQTDAVPGLWYYNGNMWIQSVGASGTAGATGATGATGLTGATGSFQAGTTPGEMLYWNGSAWVVIPPASEYAQYLNFCNGVPTWGGCLPLVTTTNPGSIIGGSAQSGGTIVNSGANTITSKGVCWSTSSNPTLSNNFTNNGSGSGNFTSTLTNMTNNTLYYIRAYATNGVGTTYGNEVSFTSASPVSIGDNYLGGKVAYILQSGDPGYDINLQHGIISATTDQSAGIAWGCDGTTIPGTSANIGTGQANTTLIVSNCSTTSAAKTCDNLNYGGYSDWYLPSKFELKQLYTNQALIGGFTLTTEYWSSTDYSTATAYVISFVNGSASTAYKTNNQKVRCVRSF